MEQLISTMRDEAREKLGREPTDNEVGQAVLDFTNEIIAGVAATAIFEIDVDADEAGIWETFRRDGSVTLAYDNGMTDLIKRAVYYFRDDFAASDDVTDEGFNFGAGYETQDGHLCDQCNIPASVFKEMFSGRIPAGVKVEWNGAEAAHFVTASKPFSVGEARAFIEPILIANGFAEG